MIIFIFSDHKNEIWLLGIIEISETKKVFRCSIVIGLGIKLWGHRLLEIKHKDVQSGLLDYRKEYHINQIQAFQKYLLSTLIYLLNWYRYIIITDTLKHFHHSNIF